MTWEVDPVKCANEECTATFKPHYWGAVKAHGKGWFMSRDDKVAYCPEHLPDWVEAWREKKAAKGGKG